MPDVTIRTTTDPSGAREPERSDDTSPARIETVEVRSHTLDTPDAPPADTPGAAELRVTVGDAYIRDLSGDA